MLQLKPMILLFAVVISAEFSHVNSAQWCSEHEDRINICDGDIDNCWKAGMDLCDSEGASCFGVMINAGWTQAFSGVKICLSNVMADKGDWLTRMKKPSEGVPDPVEDERRLLKDLSNPMYTGGNAHENSADQIERPYVPDDYQWIIRDNTNCYPTQNGADDHSCCARSTYTIETFESCQQLCIDTFGCNGITITDAAPRRCYLRHNIVLDNCVSNYPGVTSAKVTKPGSRSVYRVSNNGVTGWHPEVSEILVYADHVCTKPIQATFVEESGHIIPKNTNGFGDGSAAFDGDETTFWRPQCHYVGGGSGVPNRCEANEAWVTFSTTEQVKCVVAHNLGVQRSPVGSETWNGGILVELQLRDGIWTTAMESQSGNMAHGQPDLRSSGCSPPNESEKINVIRNCPQLDERGGIASCFNEGYTRYPSLEAAWDACAKIPECEYVQKYRYGYWYLRRFSDPIDRMIQGYGFNYDCEKARRKL